MAPDVGWSEPETYDDTSSLLPGQRACIPAPRPIANGQQIDFPVRLTFEANRLQAGGRVLVADISVLVADISHAPHVRTSQDGRAIGQPRWQVGTNGSAVSCRSHVEVIPSGDDVGADGFCLMVFAGGDGSV